MGIAEIKERDDAVKEGKGSRTPRNNESITKGALSLELKERVELRRKLDESIGDELKSLEAQLAKAKDIVNGS